MKKKVFGIRVKKILAAIGCLVLAFLFWLIIRYGQIVDFSTVTFNF